MRQRAARGHASRCAIAQLAVVEVVERLQDVRAEQHQTEAPEVVEVQALPDDVRDRRHRVRGREPVRQHRRLRRLCHQGARRTPQEDLLQV